MYPVFKGSGLEFRYKNLEVTSGYKVYPVSNPSDKYVYLSPDEYVIV